MTQGDWKEAQWLPRDWACQVRHFSHDIGVNGGVLNAKQDTLARPLGSAWIQGLSVCLVPLLCRPWSKAEAHCLGTVNLLGGREQIQKDEVTVLLVGMLQSPHTLNCTAESPRNIFVYCYIFSCICVFFFFFFCSIMWVGCQIFLLCVFLCLHLFVWIFKIEVCQEK